MNGQQFELPPLELELKEVKEVVRCFLHTILFNRALGTIKPKEVECDPPFDITYSRCDDPAILKTVEDKVDAFDAALTKAPPGKGNTCILSFYDEVQKTKWGGLSTAKEKVYWEQWTIPILIANPNPNSTAAATASAPNTAAAAGGATTTAGSSAASGGNKPGMSAAAGGSTSTAAGDRKDAKSKGGGGVADRERRIAARVAAVRDRMFTILSHINEQKDHIPAFKKGAAVCYPFELAFAEAGTDGTTDDSNWAYAMLKRVVKAGPPLLMTKS